MYSLTDFAAFSRGAPKKMPREGKNMNKTTDCLVKCPFYQSEKENYIVCEGFIASTCMVTRFPDTKHKRSHLKDNCYLEDGGKCPMARNLFEKYGMRDLMHEANSDDFCAAYKKIYKKDR